MEIIKQGIFVPLAVTKQIVIIFAGTNGYLDEIPVDQVKTYESQLSDALDSIYADFIKLLNKEQALTDQVKEQLNSLLTEFTEKFKNSLNA